MKMQPGSVCAGERRTRADAVVTAAFQIVQTDPYADAALGVVGARQQMRIVLESGRKRLGIGDIGDDHRPNSDVTCGGEAGSGRMHISTRVVVPDNSASA